MCVLTEPLHRLVLLAVLVSLENSGISLSAEIVLLVPHPLQDLTTASVRVENSGPYTARAVKIVKISLLAKQVLLNVNLAQMEPLMVLLVTVLSDGYGNGKDYIAAFVNLVHQERTRQKQ